MDNDIEQLQKDKIAYIDSMKARTKDFAVRVVKLCQSLAKDPTSRLIMAQLLRAGTAVGANYRAACRARTNREFTNKIRIVLEEADESQYWLELIIAVNLAPAKRLSPLLQEATELTAIFTAAHAKAAFHSTKKRPTRKSF